MNVRPFIRFFLVLVLSECAATTAPAQRRNNRRNEYRPLHVRIERTMLDFRVRVKVPAEVGIARPSELSVRYEPQSTEAVPMLPRSRCRPDRRRLEAICDIILPREASEVRFTVPWHPVNPRFTCPYIEVTRDGAHVRPRIEFLTRHICIYHMPDP